MKYIIIFLEQFYKVFESLEQHSQTKILEVIEENNFTKYNKLHKTNNIYKFRIGQERVLFRIHKNFIWFIDIRHRKKVYNNKFLKWVSKIDY